MTFCFLEDEKFLLDPSVVIFIWINTSLTLRCVCAAASTFSYCVLSSLFPHTPKITWLQHVGTFQFPFLESSIFMTTLAFFFARSERRVGRLGWFWGRREAFFPARCCGRAGAVQKLPWNISDARLQQLERSSQKVVCVSLSQAHETGKKGCWVHKLFSPDNVGFF